MRKNELDAYTVQQIVKLIDGLDIGEFVDKALEVVHKRTEKRIDEEYIEGFREGSTAVKDSLKEVLSELEGIINERL